MKIDDMVAAARAGAAKPIWMQNYETGEAEAYYVLMLSPEWIAELRRPLPARHQWYWDRHVERFNRRQVRLGLPTMPRSLVGEVGQFSGVRITEGA